MKEFDKIIAFLLRGVFVVSKALFFPLIPQTLIDRIREKKLKFAERHSKDKE